MAMFAGVTTFGHRTFEFSRLFQSLQAWEKWSIRLWSCSSVNATTAAASAQNIVLVSSSRTVDLAVHMPLKHPKHLLDMSLHKLLYTSPVHDFLSAVSSSNPSLQKHSTSVVEPVFNRQPCAQSGLFDWHRLLTEASKISRQ